MITDFKHAQGNLLLIGKSASRADFTVVFGHATNDQGREGNDNIRNAYIVDAQTGQALWPLVDGADLSNIIVTSQGVSFDLLA